MPTSTSPSALAIVNARAWTADPRRPWADAVLVRGARIVLVGSSAEVRKLAGPEARVIDAKRRTLVPTPPGMLRAGMAATMTLVDRDITRTDPAAHGDATILLSVVDGQVVHEAHTGG